MGNGKGELRDSNSQVLEYLRKQYMHNELAVCTLTLSNEHLRNSDTQSVNIYFLLSVF